VKHNIHSAITDLAVPVDTLIPLPNNPRKGDVDSIASSYAEFGQVRPIVVRPNDDGTATVIAGNHQLQAAKQLGWTHIAVVEMDADDTRALAFAIADNRTNELGHTDDDLLHEALGIIIEDYGDLLENLQWDEFELAILDLSTERGELATPGIYEQPVIVPLLSDEHTHETRTNTMPQAAVSFVDAGGEDRLEQPDGSDTKALVTQGSTSAGMAGGSRAVVQYSLVFDDPTQQRRWYDFMRWLRNDPAQDGDTIAERLMGFLEAHADF
jgi:hypothetical protein